MLTIIFCGVRTAKTEVLKNNRYKLSFHYGNPKESRNEQLIRIRHYRRLAEKCANDIEKLLNIKLDAKIELSILIHQDPAFRGFSSLLIKEEDSYNYSASQIIELLIKRYAYQLNPNSKLTNASIAFLTAAVNYQLFNCHSPDGITIPPPYNNMRPLFELGLYPTVKQLLNHPVSIKEELFHALYSAHAHLLVTAIVRLKSKDKHPTIQRILEMLSFGRDPYISTTYIINKFLKDGKTCQQWFQQQINLSCSRTTTTKTTNNSLNKFEKLYIFEHILPGTGDYASQKIPLHELANKLTKGEHRNQTAKNIATLLTKLSYDSPILMRKPILELVPLLQKLANNKTWGYAKKMKLAAQKVREQAQKQQKIEEWLQNYEQENSPPEDYFKLYFFVIQQRQKDKQQSTPQLENYLDKLEKDLDIQKILIKENK